MDTYSTVHACVVGVEGEGEEERRRRMRLIGRECVTNESRKLAAVRTFAKSMRASATRSHCSVRFAASVAENLGVKREREREREKEEKDRMRRGGTTRIAYIMHKQHNTAHTRLTGDCAGSAARA